MAPLFNCPRPVSKFNFATPMEKLLILVLVALIACAPAVRADDMSPEKRQAIEKMLKATGMEETANQIMTQMITAFKNKSPEMPDEFWTRLLQQKDPHEFIERIIPVYNKCYTLEDLNAINAFYDSPAGRKVLANLPLITRECMKIGQDWAQEFGQRVSQQVQDEKQKQGAAGSTDGTK